MSGLVCLGRLIAGLSLLLRKTRLGRALRTIAEDSDTALLLGVDVGRIVPLVFVISGLFAALAGVLFALNYRQVHPFMGEALGLKGISAMVVGGMGNIWGAIAGGLIIGLAEAFSIQFLRRRFRRYLGLWPAAADPRSSGRPACSAARARERAHERLSRRRSRCCSRSTSSIAYGAFLPIAAGQLNLGVAGFAAIGGYASAFLSNQHGDVRR